MPDKISMISLLVCLGLIYFTSLFFWLRFLYIRSLSTAEKRNYFFSRLVDLFFYIPIGLQAAFLFCYALFHLPVNGKNLASLFDKALSGNKNNPHPDLYPLQLIFTATLLLAVNFIFIRMAASAGKKAVTWLLRVIIFLAGIFLLRTLLQNIYESTGWNRAGHIPVDYSNYYVWLPAIVISLVFSVAGGEKPKTAANTKYLALASRLLWFYCFIAFVVGLPRIIFLIIERLN